MTGSTIDTVRPHTLRVVFTHLALVAGQAAAVYFTAPRHQRLPDVFLVVGGGLGVAISALFGASGWNPRRFLAQIRTKKWLLGLLVSWPIVMLIACLAWAFAIQNWWLLLWVFAPALLLDVVHVWIWATARIKRHRAGIPPADETAV